DKDNDYGYGLPFPDTILQAVGARPLVGANVLDMIGPLLTVGILSMVMPAMTKSFKQGVRDEVT
ncbi:unnamed protein product, partial [marine sediment metagenome]